jgi:hypothetical protein
MIVLIAKVRLEWLDFIVVPLRSIAEIDAIILALYRVGAECLGRSRFVLDWSFCDRK